MTLNCIWNDNSQEAFAPQLDQQVQSFSSFSFSSPAAALEDSGLLAALPGCSSRPPSPEPQAGQSIPPCTPASCPCQRSPPPTPWQSGRLSRAAGRCCGRSGRRFSWTPDKEVEGMAWAGGRVGSKGVRRVELWSKGLGRGRQVVCKEGGGKCVDIRGRTLGREPARMDGRMRLPGLDHLPNPDSSNNKLLCKEWVWSLPLAEQCAPLPPLSTSRQPTLSRSIRYSRLSCNWQQFLGLQRLLSSLHRALSPALDRPEAKSC